MICGGDRSAPWPAQAAPRNAGEATQIWRRAAPEPEPI